MESRLERLIMNGLDHDEFADELALMAENDGKAYRNGKNANEAIHRAFAEFRQRRRTEEREEFSVAFPGLLATLNAQWGN